jgi:hypothetical protein
MKMKRKVRKGKVITEKVWNEIGPEKIYELLKKTATERKNKTQILLSYMAGIRGPDAGNYHMKNIFQGFIRGGMYHGFSYDDFLQHFDFIKSLNKNELYKHVNNLYKCKLHHYLVHCKHALLSIQYLNLSPKMYIITDELLRLAKYLRGTDTKSIVTVSLLAISKLTHMKESEVTSEDLPKN